MIVFRHLCAMVWRLTWMMTLVLLLISLANRFRQYLEKAAQGELDSGLLALLLACRLPEFLQLILPLAMFLGVLLGCGRLQADREFIALGAAGYSRARLLVYLWLACLPIMALTMVVSLWLTPVGLERSSVLLQNMEQRAGFHHWTPGHFQQLPKLRGIIHIGGQGADAGVAENWFLAEQVGDWPDPPSWNLSLADQASLLERPDGYGLELRQGQLYQGVGVSGTPQIIGFTSLFRLLPFPVPEAAPDSFQGRDARSLWRSAQPADQALLQWQLSLALMIPVVVMLAFALATLFPRGGAYTTLLPGVVLFLAYLALLGLARELLEQERLWRWAGLFWVHGLFAALGLLLLTARRGWWNWKRRSGR